MKNIKDDLFGEWTLDTRSSARYWVGKTIFAPTNSEIQLFTYEGNPTAPELKNFYLEFEARYFELLPEIQVYLQKAYIERLGDISLDQITQMFVPSYITFPRIVQFGTERLSWDLGYSYDSSKPDFSVEMNMWKPEVAYAGE